MLMNVVIVGAGGFLGAVSRYLVSLATRGTLGAFPLGTLIVNIVGCFLIGALSSYSERSLAPGSVWPLFLATGVLGGFTTFSAFGLETVSMIREQQVVAALIYISLSLVLGLSAVVLGRLL